jgi:hypothetical protein
MATTPDEWNLRRDSERLRTYGGTLREQSQLLRDDLQSLLAEMRVLRDRARVEAGRIGDMVGLSRDGRGEGMWTLRPEASAKPEDRFEEGSGLPWEPSS